ncbi:MAG: hypothetical protein WA865_06100 [Spirulinaceae cyanobacterium]
MDIKQKANLLIAWGNYQQEKNIDRVPHYPQLVETTQPTIQGRYKINQLHFEEGIAVEVKADVNADRLSQYYPEISWVSGTVVDENNPALSKVDWQEIQTHLVKSS